MNVLNIKGFSFYKYALFGVALFAVAGCDVVGKSQPTEFYVMTEAGSQLVAQSQKVSSSLQIGIGPIDIPGYVDRPQIVTIGEGAKLNVADLDHWAEPVQKNIERILVSNVSKLITTEQVFPYPANFHPSPESLQLSVEIRDMVQTENGMVRLVASWNVKRMLDNKLLARKAASYEKKAPVNDYAIYASTLSELFGRLSADMVQSIRIVTKQES